MLEAIIARKNELSRNSGTIEVPHQQSKVALKVRQKFWLKTVWLTTSTRQKLAKSFTPQPAVYLSVDYKAFSLYFYVCQI